jgi:hypothetical protein
VSISIEAEVNQNDLAQSIAREYDMTRGNYKGLIEFIVDIDDYVCDLQFTKALRDRLNEIIEEENE